MKLTLYTSCDEDELATEMVFSNLLKGDRPGEGGVEFKKLQKNIDKVVFVDEEDGNEQTIKMWSYDPCKIPHVP